MYKRTHEGDPDPKTGRFGVYNCMGRVRDQEIDAVIGVGGIGAVAEREGVAHLVNWIGIEPKKSRERCRFGYNVTMVRFETFRYVVPDEIDFRKAAPRLSQFIYGGKIRHVVIDGRYPALKQEAVGLLVLASSARWRTTVVTGDGKRSRIQPKRQCH